MIDESPISQSNYPLRAFVCHSSKDIPSALQLKRLLEVHGIDVFVAHKDIRATRSFPPEILNALKKSDIFIQLLTKSFKDSDWTDQETGIAIATNALIIPLNLGINPYGFVKDTQALHCPDGVTQLLAEEIIALILSERSDLRARVIDSFVQALGQSRSWDNSNRIARRLNQYIGDLSPQQVDSICSFWVSNTEVRTAYDAIDLARSLHNNRSADVNDETLQKLNEAFAPVAA